MPHGMPWAWTSPGPCRTPRTIFLPSEIGYGQPHWIAMHQKEAEGSQG